MFSNPVFLDLHLPTNCEIIFVADLFVDEYVGGAELTTQALIDSCPYTYHKYKASQLTPEIIENGKNLFWIFGNIASINPELLRLISCKLKYSVLEYDYKYCKYRSPEKHVAATGHECDCEKQFSGKLISEFFRNAKSIFWMAAKQRDFYLEKFPFLSRKRNVILSSVFDKKTLSLLKDLRTKSSGLEKNNWLVLGSDSWVKGFSVSKKYCDDLGLSYEVVWNIPYFQLLQKMSSAKGFVYLPLGSDTCPRMIIEAKLLGCNSIINNYVQHVDESWFNTDNIESVFEYLEKSPHRFWEEISINRKSSLTISGYTTTYNCVERGYPFAASIRSLFQFCDEVCVADGGSSDGTLDILSSLQAEFNKDRERLKVKIIQRDWDHPRHAVFDGLQKAEARKMCTGDFCWQMDSDEIVHEIDAHKVANICNNFPVEVDIACLPVVEYWGGLDKVRIDVMPWKWRLSRNKPNITHGMPIELRAYDENGDLYAKQGTDGCDMIDAESAKRLAAANFHTVETENLRLSAIAGDSNALKAYSDWFNKVILNLPGVYHYSWYDMVKKMKNYRIFWTKFWNSLYNKSLEDTADTNMMFDLPWSEVTDEMIESRAKELAENTGGWIWHKKWDGTRIPHITVNVKEPYYGQVSRLGT